MKSLFPTGKRVSLLAQLALICVISGSGDHIVDPLGEKSIGSSVNLDTAQADKGLDNGSKVSSQQEQSHNIPGGLTSVSLTEPNSMKGKIVGGTDGEYGDHPWQARVHAVPPIRKEDGKIIEHLCGAVVISEYWLLSAAHCFESRKSRYRIVIGDYNLSQNDTGEQWFEIDELILHERFDNTTYDNDIALVKIKPNEDGRGITFNDFAQPVRLPKSSTPFIPGTRCMISGWGSINMETHVEPNIMQVAEIPLIGKYTCKKLYKKSLITRRMFCAGYEKGAIDSCEGDSGGPLVCKIRGVNTLFGITSWGDGCGKEMLPGVYTRVSKFMFWIKSSIEMHDKH